MAKRGRPQNADDFLAMEVRRVMGAYRCGVRAACQRIARGGKKEKVPLPSPTRGVEKKRPMPPQRSKIKSYTVGSPWKGQNAGTLEQRYFRWLEREKQRQKILTIEIP